MKRIRRISKFKLLLISILALVTVLITTLPVLAQTPVSSPSPSPSASPPASSNTAGVPGPQISVGPSGSPVINKAPPFTPDYTGAPPEVQQYAKNWPLPHHDYENTRWTKDSAINSSNVSKLQLAWSANISAKQLSTTPIIMGNDVFIQDRRYNVFNLDFNTGQVKWQTNYNNADWTGPNGVCVGYGKVFASTTEYNQAALDMKTGKEIWNVGVSNNWMIYYNIHPTVWNNMVFAATSGHVAYDAPGLNGMQWVFDQATGAVKWTFYDIDTPDTWGHPEINSGGGSWMTPAIDVKTGVVYYQVKNPGNGVGPLGPYVGTKEFPNGSSRPGPDLYTNCTIALDAKTGKLLWFCSLQPHDIYDHDVQNPPILVQANITSKGLPAIRGMGEGNESIAPNIGPNAANTGVKDVLITSSKGGFVYCLDRKDGSLLWKTPVGRHENDQLEGFPDNPVLVYPGLNGGVQTMTGYADGLVFAPYANMGGYYSSTGFTGDTPWQEGTGGLAAIDVNTGNIVWNQQLNALNYGSVVIANDVVFTATYDGTIYAFKTTTGEKLWTYKASAGINGWPAIAGDTLIWPCGASGTPQVIALKLSQ